MGIKAGEGDSASNSPVIELPGPLTWEECVRLTIKHNPDLEAFREKVLNSKALRSGASSKLYPLVSANFTDTRSYQGASLVAPRNYSTAYSEQLTASQMIFDGFATQGKMDQTRSQLNLDLANLNAEKATLSFNLKSAFAQLLYAQKLLKISQDVIDIRETSYRLVKLLYEGGGEDKGAMSLTKANLALARRQFEQAKRTCDLSGLQLAVSMGVNLSPPIRVEGELVTQMVSLTLPDYRQLALQTPAYSQKHAQMEAAKAGITIAESDWYPTITANASAGRTWTGQLPDKILGWSTGFSASYPLFEGGNTYFNVKAATALFRQSLAALRSGSDQAALVLAENFRALLDARENVDVQKELLEATALRYKIADARYRNGLVSFQDYDVIIGAYVGQQQSYLAAQRDAVLDEANWEQARGMGALP